MDINLVLGIVVGIVSLYFGAPMLKTDFQIYLDPVSATLVLGLTMAATLLSTSYQEFKSVLIVMGQLVINKKRLQPFDALKKLVHVSEVAQRVSKQDLAKEGVGVGDGFLERGLTLVAAGLDREFVQRTLETDIVEIQRRHNNTAGMVRTMGSYAPMFGMLGTVIGVTIVLQDVTNIDTIVSGMSLALITTMYGLILSGVIFIPISNKLRGISAREVLTKQIIMEGIMMIMDKEIPLKVEKYLQAFLATKEKAKKGKTKEK